MNPDDFVAIADDMPNEHQLIVHPERQVDITRDVLHEVAVALDARLVVRAGGLVDGGQTAFGHGWRFVSPCRSSPESEAQGEE